MSTLNDFDTILSQEGEDGFTKYIQKEYKKLMASIKRRGWGGASSPLADDLHHLSNHLMNWCKEMNQPSIGIHLGIRMMWDFQGLFSKVDDSNGYLQSTFF